ncbi:hypothetical protein OsI_13020 [Oryza sativa Indica Group]|uniref:Uncharacterized protein n=1 Tax=Oryza sativa subsp. indica TaxID=39946 RepID=B8APH9_ORYSI|nr:hypothetical protein OsI_13020 [Oryza sativa Indica Group]
MAKKEGEELTDRRNGVGDDGPMLTGASPELVHRLIPDHIRRQHGLNLRMLGVRMAP